MLFSRNEDMEKEREETSTKIIVATKTVATKTDRKVKEAITIEAIKVAKVAAISKTGTIKTQIDKIMVQIIALDSSSKVKTVLLLLVVVERSTTVEAAVEVATIMVEVDDTKSY